MTTDQEKSATPSVHLAALRVIAGNTDNWHGTKEALQGVAEYLEELELANIQLREELKVTDYLRETVHKQRDQIVELMKKLSVATEQLAIAQAREVHKTAALGKLIALAYGYFSMGTMREYEESRDLPIDRTALDEEIRKALINVKTIRQMLCQATSWGRTYYNVINAVDWSEMQEWFINNLLANNSLTPTSQQSTEPSE